MWHSRPLRRYRAGAEPLSTLLDAQRALFSGEDALLNERLARLTAAVMLRVAGW